MTYAFQHWLIFLVFKVIEFEFEFEKGFIEIQIEG
jgi:hypothetical protein